MKLRNLFAALAVTTAAGQGAVVVGSDYASDTAYNSGWNNGTDGGTAGTFGAWSLTSTGGAAGRFIGDSTSLGSPGADINTSGESFGMFGHSGQVSEAFRDFGGNTLGVGQTFSLELAVNFRNGQKGFDLRNSSDAVIFNFNIGNLGSGDAYTVQFAATGSGSIGNTYSSNTEFLLSFTQTSLSGGTWSITRSGGVTDFDSGTYSGVAENFKFYERETTNGSNAADNLFFNSLVVIPEPSAALLGGLGMLALLRRRRK
jgi:PEP-CTERM motif